MNDQSVIQFQFKASDFDINPDEIYRVLGYGNSPIPNETQKQVSRLFPKSLEKMDIKCGFRHFNSSNFSHSQKIISIQDKKFICGRTILRHFKNVSECLLFAGTLGIKFDDWVKAFFDSGDPYTGYLTNSIGSVVIETAIDKLVDTAHRQFAKTGLSLTNRFSPGYCGWNVSEQHPLFALLPKDFLGIHLTESALMIPVKSVSGIIGLGKNVQKMDYTCHLCSQKDCIMRKQQKD